MTEELLKNKTIVITGASGLLGRSLMKTFEESKCKRLIGLYNTRERPGLTKLDLTDFDLVKSSFAKWKPDYVIHAAAQRFPDKVNENLEGARLLNVQATQSIAKATAENGGILLYISTDYVFDGTSPPYKVDDQPNPLQNYGQLKLDGEKVTLNQSKGNLVLRIPVLYGHVEYLDESAITTLFKSLNNSTKEANVSNYERRRPAHTEDISYLILKLITKQIEIGQNNVRGIYQWSGKEVFTKFGMITLMSDIFGIEMSHIKKADTPNNLSSVKRPWDTTLDTSRIEALGISRQTPFKDGIKLCLEKWL